MQTTILSGKSAKKRAGLVDAFAKTAVTFRKLNNFNGVMQIVSAMEGAAVHRLQKTFEKVKPKSRTKYAELLELMSSSGSYKFYREVRRHFFLTAAWNHLANALHLFSHNSRP